jgi:hypothetical protein
MNFALLIPFSAARARCTLLPFLREEFIGASISITAIAKKFTFTFRAITAKPGRLLTRFPREAFGTSTTLFMTDGAIAFGY